MRRRAGGLAHVFLRQAHEIRLAVRVLPPPAVEPFDREHLDVVEYQRLAARDGESVSCQDFQTQPFILDRFAQIEFHVPDQAHRLLEHVRRGGCALRPTPLPIEVQQGSLFLRPGDRDAKGVVVGAGAILRCWRYDAPQQLGDVRLGQRRGLYRRYLPGGRAIGKDLQSAHAIAAHFGEQIEGFGRVDPVVACSAFPDDRAVWKQVFKISANGIAAMRGVAGFERQRQRQRSTLLRGDPFVVVLQSFSTMGVIGPGSHEQAIHPQTQDPRVRASAHRSPIRTR
ncbi:hypothetical protein D3C71_1444290 [compost metagenome]